MERMLATPADADIILGDFTGGIPITRRVVQAAKKVKVAGSDDPIEVGQLEIYRFVNPAGLESIGENLMKVTNASGDAIPGRPGFDGMGKTLQKFLEMSNVSVVKEMVNMIVAQRAYELNSRAIQTSDSMLQTATSLKR